MLSWYGITVRTPNDGLSNYSQGLEYIVQNIVSLAHFYNKYVKLIWYYRKNTGLGLACQTIRKT